MTDREKIESYKYDLRLLEEEYRCYGPRGTVERNKTALTRKQINAIRKQIAVLEEMLDVVAHQHKNIRATINGM